MAQQSGTNPLDALFTGASNLARDIFTFDLLKDQAKADIALAQAERAAIQQTEAGSRPQASQPGLLDSVPASVWIGGGVALAALLAILVLRK